MNQITDEYGVWEINDNFRILINPSQKWIDEHQSTYDKSQQPTMEEKLQVIESVQTQMSTDFQALTDYLVQLGVI